MHAVDRGSSAGTLYISFDAHSGSPNTSKKYQAAQLVLNLVPARRLPTHCEKTGRVMGRCTYLSCLGNNKLVYGRDACCNLARTRRLMNVRYWSRWCSSAIAPRTLGMYDVSAIWETSCPASGILWCWTAGSPPRRRGVAFSLDCSTPMSRRS